MKWQVQPRLVFGRPAFFFFGTYVVRLGRTIPPFLWSSGPKEHQYLHGNGIKIYISIEYKNQINEQDMPNKDIYNLQNIL